MMCLRVNDFSSDTSKWARISIVKGQSMLAWAYVTSSFILNGIEKSFITFELLFVTPTKFLKLQEICLNLLLQSFSSAS